MEKYYDSEKEAELLHEFLEEVFRLWRPDFLDKALELASLKRQGKKVPVDSPEIQRRFVEATNQINWLVRGIDEKTIDKIVKRCRKERAADLKWRPKAHWL